MQFTYGDQRFRIVFKREQGTVSCVRNRQRTLVMRYRTHVQLLVDSGAKDDEGRTRWVELQRNSVACWWGDEDTNEQGRRHALRGLMPGVLPELRPLLWKAYLERPKSVSQQELAAKAKAVAERLVQTEKQLQALIKAMPPKLAVA